MLSTHVLCAAILSAALLAGSSPATAQGLGSLRKKAEEAKKKVETTVDKTPNVDTLKPKAAPAGASAPAPSSGGAAPAAASSASPAAGDAAKPNAKVWENYDFVPGNKVIFFTDFSEDKVGNFARGLKYKGGPAEIVERNDTKVLRATGPAELLIPLGRKLPERFTLEVDVIAPQSGVLNRALLVRGRGRSAWRRQVGVDHVEPAGRLDSGIRSEHVLGRSADARGHDLHVRRSTSRTSASSWTVRTSRCTRTSAACTTSPSWRSSGTR